MSANDDSRAGVDNDRKAPVQASARTRIAAPPELVWSVLADIAAWPQWNRDVARAQLRGALAAGTRFDWKAGGLPIRSVLLAVERPGTLAWSGTTLGIKAVHVSRFVGEGEGTEAVTEESFDGLLPRLFRGPMNRTLEKSISSGLEALKEECERRVRAGDSMA